MGGAPTIAVAGVPIAVRDSGAGEPLILLHGFPEDGGAWSGVARCLKGAGLRVVAPDLPGYGTSSALETLEDYRLDRMATRIVALADALGLGRFHLAGHDWGSAIAFTIAARHADRVASLTAIDAPHPEAFGAAARTDPAQLLRSSYIGFFQLPWVPERMIAAGDFAMLKRSLRRTARAGTFSDAELERLATFWSQPGRLTAMLAYYRALRLPLPPVGTIRVPTTILWGARDAFVGTRRAAASAACCEDARIHVHRHATHWVHREEPEWIARHILAGCDRARA